MLELLFILPIALIGGGVGWFMRQHRWHQRLARFAEQHQLTYRPGTHRAQPKVTGSADIRIDIRTSREDLPGLTYTVIQASGGIPSDIALHARSFFGTTTFQSADSDFDQEVAVWGDEQHLRCLLDAQARTEIRAAIAQKVEVADGRVTWKQMGRPDDLTLETSFAQVTALARLLRRPTDLGALAAIAEHDLPPVAEAALAAMPLGPTRDATVDRILAHRCDQVMLAAARLKGPAAESTLAQTVENTALSFEFRAQALRYLNKWDAALPLAHRCLARYPFEIPLLIAAFEVLEAHSEAPPLPQLEDYLTHPAPIAEIAVRLARLHTAAAEPFLVSQLPNLKNDALREAIDALGAIGSPQVVLHLRALIAAGAYVASAQAAITAIQTRAGHEGGALALADNTHGALTLEDP